MALGELHKEYTGLGNDADDTVSFPVGCKEKHNLISLAPFWLLGLFGSLGN